MWAGKVDGQTEWIGRKSGRAGRVGKAGTVDRVWKVAQLIFFVPLPTSESLHWIFAHLVIHNFLLILVISVDTKLNSPIPMQTHVFITGKLRLWSIFFKCKTAPSYESLTLTFLLIWFVCEMTRNSLMSKVVLYRVTVDMESR